MGLLGVNAECEVRAREAYLWSSGAKIQASQDLNKGLKDHSRKQLEGEHVSFCIIWSSRLTSLWIFSYVKSFVVLGVGWVYNIMLKHGLFSCSLVGIRVERLLVLNQVLWKLIDLFFLLFFFQYSLYTIFSNIIISFLIYSSPARSTCVPNTPHIPASQSSNRKNG